MAIQVATQDMPRQSALAAARLSGNEDRLSDVLSEIRTASSPLFHGVAELTALLRETDSRRVRAAVSMALAEIGDKEAIAPLIEVLQRPEIAKASGTLIFALSELGASIPLDLAIKLVANGSFEGRSGILELMEEGRILPFAKAEAEAAREQLVEIEAGTDAEAAEAASLAREYLDRATG